MIGSRPAPLQIVVGRTLAVPARRSRVPRRLSALSRARRSRYDWAVMGPSRIPRRDLLALGTVSPLLSAALGAQASSPRGPDTSAARRAELYGLLGRLPDRHRAVATTK